MTLDLVRRSTKGTPLTAADHDGNLDKLEQAIEGIDPAEFATAAQGAKADTAIQPDNPALSNARTPTAHAASHATGGTDAITPAAIGAATAAQGAKADTAVQPAALSAYVQTSDARLSDAREWSAETIGQAEAEAGTATTRRAFTAQRVFQAIAAWWAASSAKTKLDGIESGAQVNAPTDLTYDAATREVRSSTGADATLPLVTASAAGLVPAFTSATGKVFTDDGWATPSAGAPGGSSGQLQWNNGGAFAGLSTTSIDGSGNITFSARWINSRNGAANEPASALTGTWFTGGTTTTTKPHFLIEPAGTTSTSWSTSGTGLGVNAPSGFTGNLLDLQVNGTSRLAVTSAGSISMPASGFVNEHISFGNASGIQINNPSRWGAKSGGGLAWTITNTVFTINGGYDFGFSSSTADLGQDVTLKRDAAGTLAQRNGTAAQAFRLYNTFTSATNFERLNVRWTSNEAILDTEAGSGGGTLRGLKIGSASTSLLGFYGATPAVQPAAVADATDASTVITQLNALLSRLRTIGIIAT